MCDVKLQFGSAVCCAVHYCLSRNVLVISTVHKYCQVFKFKMNVETFLVFGFRDVSPDCFNGILIWAGKHPVLTLCVCVCLSKLDSWCIGYEQQYLLLWSSTLCPCKNTAVGRIKFGRFRVIRTCCFKILLRLVSSFTSYIVEEGTHCILNIELSDVCGSHVRECSDLL